MSEGFASWYVCLMGKCPCCGDYVDYSDSGDFMDDMSDDLFYKSNKSHNVTCPSCNENFDIETEY